MDPLIGRTVGGVKIEARLGSGGMASVYAGPDEEAGGARRAIKLLSVASPELYQVRFDREARIGHSLTHPSCVRVHRWGVSGDYRFMVMELVEGEDLSRLLRRDGPLHWTRVAALGRDVANALQAAHDKGIVHRDLKPQNLLVDGHGRLKLADFGLSHWRDGPPDLPDGASLTATGDAFGTPAYMAPEQFRDAKSAGPAADLYALGVLLFEALAGRVPFNASTPVDLARLHREVAAPSLDALAAETPEPMRRLVARLLEKDPKARPASAAAVARELEDVAVRGPTAPSGHEPGPVTDRGRAPTEAPRRRGRGPQLLVVAGLAAGVAALAATGKLERGIRYGLATPEERARLLAIRAAREQVAKDPRAYVEALEGYLRDFGAQGWLADRVRELRDTPASLGERRWLLPVDHAEMVHVPGGPHRIGVEGGDDRTATRPRAVNVAGFLIDRVEVSNRRYERFLAEWRSAGAVHRCGDERADHAVALPRSLAGHGQDPDGPVVSVTPWDALEYARFYGRRLPTEVEWEVAASWDPAAGAPRPWPWGDKPPSETGGRFFANLAVAGFGTVNDAGEFVPLCTTAGHFPSDVSALGVADLGGNAAEWCAGTQPLPGRQPLRGGSVLTKDPLAARAAARRDVEPKAITPDAGFRTVTPFEGQ